MLVFLLVSDGIGLTLCVITAKNSLGTRLSLMTATKKQLTQCTATGNGLLSGNKGANEFKASRSRHREACRVSACD